jgi:cell shape-determining protein MreC
MKKLITLIIVLTAVFSLLSTFAFATEAESTVTSDENFFEALYNELAEHSDKIFSLLSFIGSVFLIITYRKGMLPILRGGISSLTSGVSRLKEEAKKSGELSEGEIKCATEKLSQAEELLKSLSKKLEALNGELEAAKTEQKKN